MSLLPWLAPSTAEKAVSGTVSFTKGLRAISSSEIPAGGPPRHRCQCKTATIDEKLYRHGQRQKAMEGRSSELGTKRRPDMAWRMVTTNAWRLCAAAMACTGLFYCSGAQGDCISCLYQHAAAGCLGVGSRLSPGPAHGACPERPRLAQPCEESRSEVGQVGEVQDEGPGPVASFSGWLERVISTRAGTISEAFCPAGCRHHRSISGAGEGLSSCPSGLHWRPFGRYADRCGGTVSRRTMDSNEVPAGSRKTMPT